MGFTSVKVRERSSYQFIAVGKSVCKVVMEGPFTYTRHACAGVNRKQSVYSVSAFLQKIL